MLRPRIGRVNTPGTDTVCEMANRDSLGRTAPETDLDSGSRRDSGFEQERGFAPSLGEAACLFLIDTNTLESFTVGVEQRGHAVGEFSLRNLCRSHILNPPLLGSFEKCFRSMYLSLRIEECCEDSLNLLKLFRISSGEKLIQLFP